jgi:hypothetical protein
LIKNFFSGISGVGLLIYNLFVIHKGKEHRCVYMEPSFFVMWYNTSEWGDCSFVGQYLARKLHLRWNVNECFVQREYHASCTSGADPRGGRTRRSSPIKLGKNMIFWRKIVIFHTKYPKNVRASLHSAQFFFKCAPLILDPPLHV